MSTVNKVVSRAYNSFEIDPNGVWIKKSSKTERLKDEGDYYYELGRGGYGRLSRFFPRVFSLDTGYTTYEKGREYSIMLERYGYKNLAQHQFWDEQLDHKTFWKNAFTSIKHILTEFDNAGKNNNLGHFPLSNATKMYIDKTKTEVNNFNIHNLKELNNGLFFPNILIVNGVEYPNFHIIWDEVKTYIDKKLLTYVPTVIHGDLCFSNILADNTGEIVRLIDPRGSFGRKGVFGDRLYDIAKLSHSVNGKYEHFIYDRFKLETNFSEYSNSDNRNVYELQFETIRDGRDAWIEKYFNEIIMPGYDVKAVKMIEGLIFCGMCDRHFDNQQRQIGMWLTGIRLLNEALEL